MIAIALHLVLRYGTHAPLRVALAPLIVVLLVGGTPLIFDLTKKLVKREFGSDLLAGVSILSAVGLGQYLVAAIVVLMLSGGAVAQEVIDLFAVLNAVRVALLTDDLQDF
jgi:cation transport ATPase